MPTMTDNASAGRSSRDRAEYGALAETCPVCATAELIAGKWTILVLRDLAAGSSRFCELEDHGIVERRTRSELPPRVDYALTGKGRALVPLIEDMRRYGREWLGTGAAARSSAG